MITLKSEAELVCMKKACGITAQALELVGAAVRPGVTTKQLDKIAHGHIIKCNARPAFLGYKGFPAACCISVNEEVIHGIPGGRVLKDGDIVSVDTGAVWGGFYGDAARTFAVGSVSEQDLLLIETAKRCFLEAVKSIAPGARVGDIGYAVDSEARRNGFSTVREYTGHGIGRQLHEDPAVENHGKRGSGIRLKSGMTLAIEPMINAGGHEVSKLSNGWTIVTADGSRSAHYENTVLITERGYEILTAVT